MNLWRSDPNPYVISDNTDDIDFKRIHYLLSEESYWSKDIPYDLLVRGLKNSLCFSILHNNGKFVGFARIVTDFATFAYLADVIIDKKNRGVGLGKFLISTIMNHPDLQGIRTWTLFTQDAHGLYEKYGWNKLDDCSNLMVIRRGTNDYTS